MGGGALLVPPDVAPRGADELTPLARRQSRLVFPRHGIARRDVLIFNPGEQGKKRKEKDGRTQVFPARLRRVKAARRARNAAGSRGASGEDDGPVIGSRRRPSDVRPPSDGLVGGWPRDGGWERGHVTAASPLAPANPSRTLTLA